MDPGTQRPITNVELVQTRRAEKDWIINAWHLIRVSSPQAGSITFGYSNHCIPNAQGVINYRQVNSRRSARLVHTGNVGESQFEEQAVSSVHAENHLTRIDATNWRVDFDVRDSLNTRLLREVKIYTKTGTPTLRRSLRFGYASYDFTALLTSVVQVADGRTDSLYRCTYWGSRPAAIVDSTAALDHWNFYNGQTGNSTLIPQLGANRDPSLPTTRLGALQRLTYPTGGYSTFDYELNEYSFVRADSLTYNNRGEVQGQIGRQPHGGLRLRTMTDHPVWGGQPVVRQYSYDKLDNTSLSSGVIAEVVNAYVTSLPLEYNCRLNPFWEQQPGPCSVTYTVYRSDPVLPDGATAHLLLQCTGADWQQPANRTPL